MRNPVNYRISRLSEHGRKAARARWDRERERRAKMDAIDPVRVGGKIVERLIRIVGEKHVIERVFYEFDLPRDWKRKRREVMATPVFTRPPRHRQSKLS